MAIVKKMNVLGCNDDFFNIFLNIFVFLISFLLALLNNVVPGKQSLNFYICTGEDPRIYNFMSAQFPVSSVLPPFFLMTFIFISWKLLWAKKAMAKADVQAQGILSNFVPFSQKFDRSTINIFIIYVSTKAQLSGA